MVHVARSLALVLLLAAVISAVGSSRTPPGSTASGRAGSTSATSTKAPAQQQQRRKIIIDNDGGIEDLLSVLLLLKLQDQVDLLLVSYIEADSIAEIAVNTTLKLMHFVNRTDVPLAVSTLKPKNDFPLMYRAPTLASDVLPQLNPAGLDVKAVSDKVLVKRPGQDVLTEVLLAQKEPVTVVATGPLTNIAYALRKDPRVASRILRLWWMGGALRQPGNIFNQPGVENGGPAEWNVFADPDAAAVVWGSTVPVTIVPLDATNKVPITPALLYGLGSRSTGAPTLALVTTMYAPTITYVYLAPNDPYEAWDQLATACMLQPEGGMCTWEDLEVRVVISGPMRGAMQIVGERSRIGSKANDGGGGGMKSNSSSSSSATSKGTKSSTKRSGSGKMRDGDSGGDGDVVLPGLLSQPKRVRAAVDADAQKFYDFTERAFGA